MAFFSASSARTEQWILAGGSPPSAFMIAALDVFNADFNCFPLTKTVIMLEVAIAVP